MSHEEKQNGSLIIPMKRHRNLYRSTPPLKLQCQLDYLKSELSNNVAQWHQRVDKEIITQYPPPQTFT